jgi:hypothetical protein
VGEGDKVFSRFTWNGTGHGEFFGVPATGRQITVKGMIVDRLVAGKMVDSRILIDSLGMLSSLVSFPRRRHSPSQKRGGATGSSIPSLRQQHLLASVGSAD